MGRFRQGLFALALSAFAHVLVVKFVDERPTPKPPPLINPAALVWVDTDVPPSRDALMAKSAAANATPVASLQPRASQRPGPSAAVVSATRSTRPPAVGVAATAAVSATRSTTRAPAVGGTASATGSATRSTTPVPATVEGTPSATRAPALEAEAARPTASILTPRDDVLGPEVVDSEPSGRTLHPGDEPTDAERLAEESERVHDRVDGWARQTIRRARVANGIVDPHYSDLQRELAAATDEVPDLIGLDDPKAVATALKDAWQSGAERYGKTGAPYDTPPGWNPAIEQPESLMRQAQAGSPEMSNFVQFLSAGARLQEFADGRAGTALITTVALTQAPDGSVLELRLAEPSGVKPFDTWVMDTARTRLGSVRFDAGTRERGFSSLWQFTGRVSFMKKASAPTARTLATQIPLMALSALTGGRVPIAIGRFDEVNGTVETLDLSSPHYECTVTLLEAD